MPTSQTDEDVDEASINDTSQLSSTRTYRPGFQEEPDDEEHRLKKNTPSLSRGDDERGSSTLSNTSATSVTSMTTDDSKTKNDGSSSTSEENSNHEKASLKSSKMQEKKEKDSDAEKTSERVDMKTKGGVSRKADDNIDEMKNTKKKAAMLSPPLALASGVDRNKNDESSSSPAAAVAAKTVSCNTTAADASSSKKVAAAAVTQSNVDPNPSPKKARTTRMTRRSREPKSDDEDDDESSKVYNGDNDDEKPGAVSVHGSNRSNGPEPDAVSMAQEQQDQEDDLEEPEDTREENLPVAGEIAPPLVTGVAIPETSQDVGKDPDDQNKRNPQTKRIIIFVLVVVCVAVIVGVAVGVPLKKKNAGTAADGTNIRGSSGGNDNTITSSTPQPTSAPQSVPPTELSNKIYEVDPAYQGYNEFWTCTNTTEENVLNSDLYFCVHLADEQIKQERRPGGYPYYFYNTQLFCECKDTLDPKGNTTLGKPANENCPFCHVLFEIGDSPLLCNWVFFTNTTRSGDQDEDYFNRIFQIQYDCSNLFWRQLSGAVDKSCVGRDEDGNCFDLDTVPVPPSIPSLLPSNDTTDIATSRTIFETSELTCFDTPSPNATATFSAIRGRYQCLSDFGVPYPNSKMTTTLACTTSDGYYLGADCNCIIFLGSRSWDMTCSSCTVLPDGDSNSTLRLAYDCSNRFEGECIGYDEDGNCIDSSDVDPVCTYYDEASCQEKALELGLFLGGAGFTFAGNFITKGCQYYKSDHPLYGNRAYFGRGSSSLKEMEATPTEGNFRLTCDTVIDNPPTEKVCEIFDAESCRMAAADAGLALGTTAQQFEICVYDPQIFGCYFEPAWADPVRANAAYFCRFGDPTNYNMLEVPSGVAQRFMCNATDTITNATAVNVTVTNFTSGN